MDRRPSHALSPASIRQTTVTADTPDEKVELNAATQTSQIALLKELTEDQQEKATQIRRACKDKDIAALVGLAASRDGFVSDELRRSACESHEPFKLSCHIGAVFRTRYWHRIGGQD